MSKLKDFSFFQNNRLRWDEKNFSFLSSQTEEQRKVFLNDRKQLRLQEKMNELFHAFFELSQSVLSPRLRGLMFSECARISAACADQYAYVPK